jgi:hypothetical protein
MGKAGSQSSAAARIMFSKIKVTKAANEQLQRQVQQHRLSDPFEQAKTLLQRRGYAVFSQSLIEPRSKLICVGLKLMTKDEMIAFANERFPRNDR